MTGIRSVGGLAVASAWRHEGPARVLIRRLKYDGMPRAAVPMAMAMAGRLPPEASALVPVPRVAWRRIRHGVDPAGELVRVLSGLTGLPVLGALQAPLFWPRRAGRGRADRRPPVFEARRSVPAGAVLVDDVLTTGGTIAAAAAVLGNVRSALTATVAGYTMWTRPEAGTSGARERA